MNKNIINNAQLLEIKTKTGKDTICLSVLTQKKINLH